MSWSNEYYFAIQGNRETLDKIVRFINGLPANDELTGVHLHDARVALYGERYISRNKIRCSGAGYIYWPSIDEDGTLNLTVSVFKNYLEWTFIRALRRKFGNFKYVVFIDDTELCQDRVPYTTDRQGKYFPHFTLNEGAPEFFEDFPYIHNLKDIREETIRNCKELIGYLRGRGFRVTSFKDLVRKYPDMKLHDPKTDTVIVI